MAFGWDEEPRAAALETYNRIIGIEHKAIDTYPDVLAAKLKELYHAIGVIEIYILSHLRLDWFGNRDGAPKPLADSYTRLDRIVQGSTYDGAFHIDLPVLDNFIGILFWMARYDPAAPEYIFLFDDQGKTQLNLCRYVNIHLTMFSKEHLTDGKLAALGWTIVEGPESDRFPD